MSSRGAVPERDNENSGWSSHLPSRPTTLPMSRKRPRRDESPRNDNDSTIDATSKSLSFMHPEREDLLRMESRFITIPSIETDAEEINTRDISATVEAELERGGLLQTLPPSFRNALDCLRQELRDLDSYIFRPLRSGASQHVDEIYKQISKMENSHRTLYSDFCNQQHQEEELQHRLSQQKDQTDAATQEKDQAIRELDDLKETIAWLQTSIKDSKRDRAELANSIKDLEGRIGRLKAEKKKVEDVVEAKNVEIEVLKASPISVRPRALIQPEALDSLPPSSPLSVPPTHTTPVVADAEDRRTNYKYEQLGFGSTSFLSNLLDIELAYEQPSNGRRSSSVVTEFLFNLGSLANRADAAVSRVEGFWKLQPPWTSEPISTMAARKSIEARFVQLCLLIPHLKSGSRGKIWSTTIKLIQSLMIADHASAPHAGMAFLVAMRSTCPVAKVQNLNVQNVAIAIALCELCRFLQQSFTDIPQATWDIGDILGSEIQGSATITPIGRLSACLANLHRRDTSTLRKQLATKCGDKFCFSSVGKQPDRQELGFLSCDDNENFLLLNFGKRTIRFVDRNLAYAILSEDGKKHLLVKMSDENVLLDIPDAAHDVRRFWVNYAERPDATGRSS